VRAPQGRPDTVVEAVRLAALLIGKDAKPSFDYLGGKISNVAYEGVVEGRRVRLDAMVDSVMILGVQNDGPSTSETSITIAADVRRQGMPASYGPGLAARLAEAGRLLDRIATQHPKRLAKASLAWDEAIEVLKTWIPTTSADSASLRAPTPWGPLGFDLRPAGKPSAAMEKWLRTKVPHMHELRRVLLDDWRLGPAEWNERADQMGRGVVESMRTMSKHPEAFRP
jgi:hypothetical protein